jgi:hypothetical protein
MCGNVGAGDALQGIPGVSDGGINSGGKLSERHGGPV